MNARIAVLSLIMVFFVFTGCDFQSPEARFADEIKTFSVDGPECDRVLLDGHGRVSRAEADLAIALVTAEGSIMKVGGIRLNRLREYSEYYIKPTYGGAGYWQQTDQLGTASNLVSLETGYIPFTGWCTLWGVYQAQTGTEVGLRRIGSTIVSGGGYVNWKDPRIGGEELIPWYTNVYTTEYGWVQGGHYRSGTPSSDIVDPVDVTSSSSAPAGAGNNMSPSDGDFLATFVEPPSSGIDIADYTWCKRSGQCGMGYSEPADVIFPLLEVDEHTLTYRSTPYFLSLQVVVAEPVDSSFVGMAIPAILYTGETEHADINVSVVAISDDGLRLVVQSDYLVPVEAEAYDLEDPEMTVYDRWTDGLEEDDLYAPLFLEGTGFDPNFIVDGVRTDNVVVDRFVPLYIVPMNDGDVMKIKIFKTPMHKLSMLHSCWLVESKIVDLNGDGIFNLVDFSIAMSL